MSEPRTPGAPDWLVGGGEMGRLVASRDWSETGVGPIDGWPQSLRTAVSLCLASNFPIALAWGPERVQIYNDGYWPITGGKHPTSMGQDFKECWYSAWPVIGSVFEQAASGEAGFLTNQRMFLDRNGYLEETFFTFSFSPIFDENGDVAGLFHPVIELTQQSLTERRLGVIRDLAERTAVARAVEDAAASVIETLGRNDLDLPFVLLYLLDESGGHARLVGRTGISFEVIDGLTEIDLARPDTDPWSLRAESMDLTVIPDLGDELGDFDAGPYPERPRTALVVPIAMVPGAKTASGFLVAGVSARRALDDGYRTFFKMLQEAVGNVLTAARAHELERARTEALAELDRAKTLFFSNVSHEFRTPLTLMLGPLEDLLRDDDVPDETQGMLRLIYRNGLRLMRLVVSLLDFSRIEAGRIEALFEPIDLDVLTADVASNFESACERAGLRLIIDCPAIGEPVYVDRQMWEKVILNLVANAFKYTLDGEIEVRLRSSHGSVALTVRDTGVGIADEHQERVFDRFQRVEGARGRTQEGTGIGLALVRELVRMHGGSINVSSQVGVGSTFTVELPLGSEHLPPERVRHESSFGPTRVDSSPFVEEALAWLPDVVSAPAPSDEQAPTVETDARILVADDNADMRRYLSSLLSEHWRVKLVSDGAAAVASAVEDPPDLILADVMMPVIDGLEMVEHLRANPRTQAVPIMLLSARAGEDSRIEGLDVGADDYLVKPFSARELVARVAARLEIASKATEARIVVEGERARLYHAFMEAPIPVAILRGEELICEMANPAALEVFGWADPVGRPILEAMPGLRDHGIDRLLHGVLQRGRTVVGREVLVRVDDPKGSREEYFDVIYEPLTDLDDRIDGIMVVASAVTAEVHARERVERALQRQAELNAVLRERQEELRLANRAKDEFLSLMSHELKTPITTIYGGAVMLESNGDELDPDTRHSLIADIQTESERLHRIIEDLLVLARGQHADAEAEPILVPRLVRKLVDDHQQRWPERHVEIIDQEPDAIVIARPTYFEQVIRNLMSNAEKYSPSDQPITIAIDRDSDMVSVEVRDRGIGLDDDELEQLFTPFYRSERAARQASGIGLGLVVCKRVIESHGGRVWASRRDGGGAVIGLTLPLADQDFDAEPDQGRDVDDRSPMVDRSNVSLGSAPGSR